MSERLTDASGPDVYAVGWLFEARYLLRLAWHLREVPRGARRKALLHATGRIRNEGRYVVSQAKRRNWRAVKRTFNGWYAEDRDGRACGTGWTKRRAVRSLNHLLAELEAGSCE